MRGWVPWLVLVACAVAGRAEITGQVLDPGGKPVPAAQVHCVLFGSPNEPLVTATAGPDGRFRLTLQPGMLYPGRTAWPGDGPPQSLIGNLVATADGYGLAWCRTKAEQAVGPLRLTPPASLAVPCVDGDGKPLAGVPLHLRNLDRGTSEPEAYLGLPTRGVPGTATVTDAAGVAHFRGLPPNARVGFKVDDPRFAQPTTSLPGIRLVSARATPVTPLVLRPAATIGGRVTDSRSGRAVPGMRVDWYSAAYPIFASAVTDGEGRYLLAQLPAGVGVLVVTSPALRDGCVAPRAGVVLEEGQTLIDQDLTVVDGVPLTIRVDAGGPLPRAEVLIVGPQLPEELAVAYWLPRYTGPDGQLTVRVLPGQQRIRVDARQAAPDYDSDRERVRAELTVAEGKPAEVTITLTKSAPQSRATVRVVDADGRPVSGARIELDRPREYARLTAGVDGRCEVLVRTDETLHVRASQARRRSAGWVKVEPGQETVVTIAERPPLGVDVYVRDPEGKPRPGATVWLSELRGQYAVSAGQAVTDATGRAAFEDVWPGCSFAANAGGGTTGYGWAYQRIVFLKPRGMCPPLVLPVADQELSGWVLDADGRPAAGASVRTFGTPSGYHEATANAQGEFKLTGLVKGKVQVQARSRDRGQEVWAEAKTGDDLVVLKLKPLPARQAAAP